VVERYDIGVARPPAGSRERHSAGASRSPWLATRPIGHDLSSHERAAALLDAHVDYRVLRALPPPARYPVVTPQGLVRTAVVIDVETIGLDPDHPIIDLAIQRIAFDARGMIVRVGQVRQWFEDPGTAIPAEITRLTGITDADVIGKRIDADEAASLIVSTTVAIAHNTAFDAPRVERRLTAIAGHAWACSCNEVAWPKLGFDGRKIGKRTWRREIAAADEPASREWLRDVCSCGQPRVTHMTWNQWHRG
jgi:hypothetical protein